LARGERLLDETDAGGAARGYLLIPRFLGAIERGEASSAAALADEASRIGRACGDLDLMALGVLGQGQAALVAGDLDQGMHLLDEVMVSVMTGEVSPIPAGIVYCAVIEACMDVFDLRRAAAWTDALDAWCGAEADLVPYRGQCLVHRSQVLQAHGAWDDAIAQADLARARLAEPAHPALGLALYQQGELHRLRGEFAEAERAYRAAGEQGREPAPGFALLRLAEGNLAAALAAIRRMLEDIRGRHDRPAVLAAAVDIFVAAEDLGEARDVCGELAALADGAAVTLVGIVADFATGSVRIAEGDPAAGLAPLRRACRGWRAQAMPYETARAQVLLGRACQMMGDDDGAAVELDAARATFTRLGALPDATAIAPPQPAPTSAGRRGPDALSQRELEVLRLVADGRTNREIATTLVISEHTVARHVQNMFTKLGVSSRAAATAHAYERGLLTRT
jgi:ATP/maltotriose-dependent transcriptional regulator MalT